MTGENNQHLKNLLEKSCTYQNEYLFLTIRLNYIDKLIS